MQFLTPPTDNLYKFKALSGVSVVLVTAYFFFQSLINLSDRYDGLSVESAVLEAEIDTLTLDLGSHRKELKEILERLEQKDIKSAERTRLIELFKTKEGSKLDSPDTFRKLKMKTAELRAKHDVLTKLRKSTLYFLFFGVPLFALGYYWAISGFSLWYDRVQRFIDLELEQRTKKIP